MKSFRNPKCLERYEDVVFDLEQALDVNPANNASKRKQDLDLLLITQVRLLHLIGIMRDFQ